MCIVATFEASNGEEAHLHVSLCTESRKDVVVDQLNFVCNQPRKSSTSNGTIASTATPLHMTSADEALMLVLSHGDGAASLSTVHFLTSILIYAFNLKTYYMVH